MRLNLLIILVSCGWEVGMHLPSIIIAEVVLPILWVSRVLKVFRSSSLWVFVMWDGSPSSSHMSSAALFHRSPFEGQPAILW